MFKNMKLGVKVLSGFIALTVIAAALGIIGTINIRNIGDADTFLYQKITLPIEYVGLITTNFNRIRVNVVNTARTNNQQQLGAYKNSIMGYDKVIKEYFEHYRETYIDENDKKIFEAFIETYNKYMSLYDKAFNLAISRCRF